MWAGQSDLVLNSESEAHAPFCGFVAKGRYHKAKLTMSLFRASVPILIPITMVINATEKTMLDRILKMTDEKQQQKDNDYWSRIARSNIGKE